MRPNKANVGVLVDTLSDPKSIPKCILLFGSDLAYEKDLIDLLAQSMPRGPNHPNQTIISSLFLRAEEDKDDSKAKQTVSKRERADRHDHPTGNMIFHGWLQ